METGCNWGRFWYLIDEFLDKKRKDDTTSSSDMKRTDEKFQQFFWNNFVQEDGALFYNHGSTSSSNVYRTVDVSHRTDAPICGAEKASLSLPSV
jgi:hypothetical protein